jgi:hypothetical protein
MAEQRKINEPLFVVRPASEGKSWSVFWVTGFGHAIEIPNFSCEKAGRYWIANVSKAWLEKLKAGRRL